MGQQVPRICLVLAGMLGLPWGAGSESVAVIGKCSSHGVRAQLRDCRWITTESDTIWDLSHIKLAALCQLCGGGACINQQKKAVQLYCILHC